MAWLILIAAGLLEIVWAVGLKEWRGLARPIASFVTIVSMIASMVLLGVAARGLPIGTAYAVWTGIGTVGTAVWGMACLNEPRDAGRIACVLLIVIGIGGLRLLSGPAPAEK